MVRDNGIERGLDALLTEAERAKKYGFTETELQRQKQAVLRSMEKAYAERNKIESPSLAAEYIRNFLFNEPVGFSAEKMQNSNHLGAEAASEYSRIMAERISQKLFVEKY